MEVLRRIDLINVIGDEIIPGSPSPEMQYINVKLMIAAALKGDKE
jgi:hypothetical protein